ncbi:DUF2075 domain-containing protein [Cytobacillus firmus]|nr:DUF2075 domain-containing protein [Cytobacillus firmus]
MNELYKGNISDLFEKAKEENKTIGAYLKGVYEKHWKESTPPSDGEVNSWNKSLNSLLDSVNSIDGLEDLQILIEYRLPSKLERIDCILTGVKDGVPIVLLVELKQWSNVNRTNSIKRVEYEWKGEITRCLHPCVQVGNYENFLRNSHSFLSQEKVNISSCVYMHNLSDDQMRKLLYSSFSHIPVFNKESDLKEFIKDKFSNNSCHSIVENVSDGSFLYSDDLLKVLGEMLEKESQPFHLIGEQQRAYEKVFELLNQEGRHIIVVKGNPGTGKTAVALNLLFLAKNEKFKNNIRFYFPSSTLSWAIRATLGESFRQYYRSIVNEENKNKIVIVDEAHRLPIVQNDNSETLYGLIKSSRVLVLFLDERQQILPEEIGTYEYISKYVDELTKKGNSKITVHDPIELNVQYRCHETENPNNESLGYLETIDELLYGDPKSKLQTSYFIKLIGSPSILETKIREHKGSRLVAGFCWEWSNPNSQTDELVDDIQIGSFSAPWNRVPKRIKYDDENAKEYSHVRWVMNAEGTEREIGCIYTAQGFDFNFIGVIWGEDLFWQNGKWSYNLNKNLDQRFVSQIYGVDKKLLKYDKTHNVWLIREETKFITLTNNRKPIISDETILKLLKNIYRVLLTRGKNGCYIYFLHKGTENYFKNYLQFSEEG